MGALVCFTKHFWYGDRQLEINMVPQKTFFFHKHKLTPVLKTQTRCTILSESLSVILAMLFCCCCCCFFFSIVPHAAFTVTSIMSFWKFLSDSTLHLFYIYVSNFFSTANIWGQRGCFSATEVSRDITVLYSSSHSTSPPYSSILDSCRYTSDGRLEVFIPRFL